jgi:hypothetical protein
LVNIGNIICLFFRLSHSFFRLSYSFFRLSYSFLFYRITFFFYNIPFFVYLIPFIVYHIPFFVYHIIIFLFSFIFFLRVLSVLFYRCVYGCRFGVLLFNSVVYIFLLSSLCILIVMYAVFSILCFHRANWHSSATLTEVFPCFFLSCKSNARA